MIDDKLPSPIMSPIVLNFMCITRSQAFKEGKERIKTSSLKTVKVMQGSWPSIVKKGLI